MSIAEGSQAEQDGRFILEALDRFEGPLILYATRILGEPERARDVVQDTFLRLCRQDQDEVRARLGEWLFTTCRNRALDVRRKESRMSTISDATSREQVSPDPEPTEVSERKDSTAQIYRVMERLPENQREVIRLKFQHGLSYREIARVTSLSVGNVGFLVHTALKSLRETLSVAS